MGPIRRINTGRIQINSKGSGYVRKTRRERRNSTPTDGGCRRSRGITLYMQPVQDLTVEDRVSRTQFQYTMEDPSADELNTLSCRGWWTKLQATARVARCRDAINRFRRIAARNWYSTATTASRLGITPSTIDNTLYDAYGQRQVSTMFTAVEPVSRGSGSKAGIRPKDRKESA